MSEETEYREHMVEIVCEYLTPIVQPDGQVRVEGTLPRRYGKYLWPGLYEDSDEE